MRHNELILELLKNEDFRKSFNSNKSRLRFLISTMLIQARKKKGLTQNDLAKKLNTTQSSIARLESGTTWPKLEFLKRIADAYDTDLIPPKFEFLEVPFGNTVREARMLTQQWEMKKNILMEFPIGTFQTTNNNQNSGNKEIHAI